MVIEGYGQLRLVTPVGHLVGAKTDDVTRSTGHRMVRRFDLCGDDLHRPDTIAHLCASLSKDLGTFLRTLTGVGNDLNGMFGYRGDGSLVTNFLVQLFLLPVPEGSNVMILGSHTILSFDNTKFGMHSRARMALVT